MGGGEARVIVGAIDCGTNSTRLLVWRDGETRTRRMVITRLGAGVDRAGELDAAAIERTLTVLRDYRSVMDELGVERVRIAATSAARDARNRDAFLDAAAEVVGARPELLGGDEEARLSFLGATAELDPEDGPFLVVDIGGGSTELAYGTTATAGHPHPGPEAVMSLDVGCVRMTERWIHTDPPAPEELHAVVNVTTQHLEDVVREHPQMRDAKTMVGLAGTISTVAAVEIGLPGYDRDALHHFVLTRAAAEDVFRTLATESRADRIHNPGLEEARADVIVGGTAVLVSVMRFFQAPSLLVSEADILDGLAMSARR
jgi:exopolyphosphatase/guanosine-5'-triphosphate,3'-diphosphate pyrophosphatase